MEVKDKSPLSSVLTPSTSTPLQDPQESKSQHNFKMRLKAHLSDQDVGAYEGHVGAAMQDVPGMVTGKIDHQNSEDKEDQKQTHSENMSCSSSERCPFEAENSDERKKPDVPRSSQPRKSLLAHLQEEAAQISRASKGSFS